MNVIWKELRPAGYLHTGLNRYEIFDFQEDD
jgi:hypothetical protein